MAAAEPTTEAFRNPLVRLLAATRPAFLPATLVGCVLGLHATRVFGFTLLAAVVPAGLILASKSGAGLVWIGLAGLAIGWAYYAPPLKLTSPGARIGSTP